MTPSSLITGTSSGVGKYLKEQLYFSNSFKRVSYNTQNVRGIHTIIHCGWDATANLMPQHYLNDAVDLAHRLLDIPHKQFIFISSIDVYPKTKSLKSESDNINVRDITGLYAITKLAVEELILARAQNPLIIRPSVLLGPYTRRSGTSYRLAKNENINVSLKSDYNFILYDDLLRFIRYSQHNSVLTGIYNLVATKNIKLKNLINPDTIIDGDFKYKAGNISNAKAVALMPDLNKTSKENYETWLKEYLS